MKWFILILTFISIGHTEGQNKFSKDKILREIYTFQDERKTDRLLPYLSHKKEIYRLAAVMAFASVQDTAVSPVLLKILSADKSTAIRRAAAYSLGQTYQSSLLKTLMAEYELQSSMDIKNTLLEAIGKCADKQVIPFFEQLKLKQTIYEGYVKGVYYAVRRKVKSDIILEHIKTISGQTAEPMLLHLCAKILSVPKPEKPITAGNLKSIPIEFIKDTLKTIGNPYHQIEFLKKYSIYAEDLYQLTFDLYALPVKTYCMETYLNLAVRVDKPRLIYILNSGNVAFVSLVCEKIRKDTLWHASDSFAIPVLKYVADVMLLPRDLEAWIDVQKTIAMIRNETYVYNKPAFQHPINWNFVVKIPELQKVRIKTNKGDIVLVCRVNDAPASVANFLQLVDSGYYNGKYFHRMVPDFVVQGACPRGDGWGTLNWTQRSEFSNWLSYQPGSVGLASAGKDSEGVQFFITHTYTSNLDGRYSIFAEVLEGMDVVNTLLVGDQIISIDRI